MDMISYSLAVLNRSILRELKASTASQRNAELNYEGAQNWTADLHLRDRILMKEIFQEYLPDSPKNIIQWLSQIFPSVSGEHNQPGILRPFQSRMEIIRFYRGL